MMHKLSAVIGGMMILAVPASANEKGPDILRIFDRFVISNAAANKCLKPDENTLAKFLANFQAVTIRAAMRLEEMYPNTPSDKIGSAIKRRVDAINSKTFALVEKEGCDGKNVIE
jgi:hypothetical protein